MLRKIDTRKGRTILAYGDPHGLKHAIGYKSYRGITVIGLGRRLTIVHVARSY